MEGHLSSALSCAASARALLLRVAGFELHALALFFLKVHNERQDMARPLISIRSFLQFSPIEGTSGRGGHYAALKTFLAVMVPCPGLFRQHDSVSLYKSPRQVTLPLQDGEMTPSMGTMQLIPTKGSLHAGQTESRRVENTHPSGSNNLVCLWEGRGIPLELI